MAIGRSRGFRGVKVVERVQHLLRVNLPFNDSDPLEHGFWRMVHDSRTDWSILLGSIFLLIVGAGPRSLDAALLRRQVAEAGAEGRPSVGRSSQRAPE
ncbi:MAG TPA: hypothetical protein VMM18_05780 [Gemmatimonadaceae bacterium]|nr:hypothetical protein [Gemmatimonadaceae bacterium]